MRKIELCNAPNELTPQVVQFLTDEFRMSGKAVWQKDYIKKTLLSMTNSKCIYSEVKLGENSTCEEVDHFYPKSIYPEKVVEWGNLMPSCRICNAKKGNVDPNKVDLINPYIDNPSDFITFSGFICVAIHNNSKGKNSINYFNLNNSHFVRPRENQIRKNEERLALLVDELSEGLFADKSIKRFLARFTTILQSAQPEEQYSVCIGIALLMNNNYAKIKNELISKGLWSQELNRLETNINPI